MHPDFPPEVEQAAAAAARPPAAARPRPHRPPVRDHRPRSSMDLDQALHIERDGDGLRRALRDRRRRRLRRRRATRSTWRPTGAARRSTAPTRRSRCTRRCSPRARPPCCPTRSGPALLWTIKVDAEGEGTDVDVERARVRSRAKLDYDGVQQDRRRRHRRRALRAARRGRRAAASSARPRAAGCPCRCPSRRSTSTASGGRWLPLACCPVEEWNAQISLLTGMAAASLMVYARVGLLRTLPPPDPRDVQRLHRTARALHIEWPAELLYPDFIRSLDPENPSHAAMIVACTRLLRGSPATSASTARCPAQPRARRAGLGVRPRDRAAAPARRPVRRRDLPRAVRRHRGARRGCWSGSSSCPKTLQDSGRRAHQYERAVLDLVEAGVLHPSRARPSPASWCRSTRRTRSAVTWSCSNPRSRRT